MSNYKLIQKPLVIDGNFLSGLRQQVINYPDVTFVINYRNTKDISLVDMRNIESISMGRIQIRVEGGYDDHRIVSYPNSTYLNMHKYDNIYSISEIRKIMIEIEKIEREINPNWSQEQKLMYFIGTLKNKIIYHPFHENAPSKDIRSLRGLFSHNTVCAGYAVILKELCDRNGIECQYVEGCTTKEDYDKGYLTHAWNIVRINGYYFPLDLTWNAGKSASGKTLTIFDIANVNEFVKSHIPGRHELIQDYKGCLKSIDGAFLNVINNLINKDMTYELSSMYFKKDGKTIHIAQVGETIVDNRSVFSYIYYVEDQYGNNWQPHMFYSCTNVLNVVRGCSKKKKLEGQLQEARRRGNTEEEKRLTRALLGSEYLPDANDLIDNLLFSRENLAAADRRGDNYIGEIRVEHDSDGRSRTNGVIVDPTFASKLTNKHRPVRRSDGTHFILETFGTIDLGQGVKVYRYKMYENIKTSNCYVTKKNTIFTDVDIMNDYRQSLADDFFGRARVDRKIREASGYLGHYSKDCIRTYDVNISKLFYDTIYRSYRMNRTHVRDYVPELTFDDMKRMVQVYTIETVNGKDEVVNRRTKKIVDDPILKSHIQFSLVWLKAAGIKNTPGEIVPGYHYAFEQQNVRTIFDEISKVIVQSIHKSGNIDPMDVLAEIYNKYSMYKFADLIVMRLFNTEESIKVLNSFYRQQNPSSIKESVSIQPISANYDTMVRLSERRKQLEEEKKKLLEVIERNGKVELIPARSK